MLDTHTHTLMSLSQVAGACRSGVCLRTIESGYGLCALFAPGNRHAVVGTKEGRLDIIDVGASSRLQSVEAHSGAVWSLAALPDNRSALSLIMSCLTPGLFFG